MKSFSRKFSRKKSAILVCLFIFFYLQVHKVATAFDPFSKLNMRTQAALLKHNADLVVSLRGAIFFESRKQGLDQVNLI